MQFSKQVIKDQVLIAQNELTEHLMKEKTFIENTQLQKNQKLEDTTVI